MIARVLRNQPAKDFEFNRASLRDVLRFLASDAGISFVSVPEVGDAEDRLVTFTLRESPFRALEIIARANGVALFFESGVWYLRPFNDSELIARTYKIKYNTQEEVTSDSAAASAPQAQTGGIGGTATGSVPDLGLSLQGVSSVFTVSPQQLLDDIKSLLGIPTTSFDAVIAGEVTVDNPGELGTSPTSVRAGTGEFVGTNVAGEPGGPQVIWNSDSNTLYVVATRQQHQWVEGYIQSMDRPQALIAIEVKFLETNRDPREAIGVDWSGTFEDGFTIAARDIRATPSGEIILNSDVDTQSRTGNPPPGESVFDTREQGRFYSLSASAPYSAVLTASDVAVTLQAFMQDRDSSQVSYPRVLTRNNREVVIRSVINQPVLASTSTVTQGIGGTTAASVAYLPIGTIINVLPKEMADGSVALNVSISISNIINEITIGQNNDLYPVASTRVFNAALSVASGYTLAIGGLEEAQDITERGGIPLLKDIPLLGEAFKSADRQQRKKNLIMFITPTLLPPSGVAGIAETPQSILPRTPNEPEPPAFSPDGMLVGGRSAVNNAARWVERRRAILAQTVSENLATIETFEEIAALSATCNRLLAQIDLMMEAYPEAIGALATAAADIERVLAALPELTRRARRSDLTF